MTLANENVEVISHWAGANYFSLNSSKTKTMLLGTARHVNGLDRSHLEGVGVGLVMFTLADPYDQLHSDYFMVSGSFLVRSRSGLGCTTPK